MEEDRKLEFVVKENNQYRRIDKFLRNQLKIVPLSEIYKLIRTGKVLVNDKTVKKPHYEIETGDRIDVLVDISVYNRKKDAVTPVPLKLDILYEDENILVLNKKAGIALHPAQRTKGSTLIQGLIFYGNKAGFQPHLVHRLDRDTSGALIVAKNLPTARVLSRMFKERLVQKEYISLVYGKPKSSGVIDIALDDSEAITEYRTLKNFQDSTLVSVILHTGRTHQIRRHFALIGNPVIGDTLYGDRAVNNMYKERYGLRRQFLHCIRLTLAHPSEPGKLQIKAPLTQDLKEVLRRLNS